MVVRSSPDSQPLSDKHSAKEHIVSASVYSPGCSWPRCSAHFSVAYYVARPIMYLSSRRKVTSQVQSQSSDSMIMSVILHELVMPKSKGGRALTCNWGGGPVSKHLYFL